jgi:hypothetical protein
MYQKVKNLKRGETIIVNELTQIYRYFEGECIVEINEGIEEYFILLDHENKSLIYESLI